jgi:hypothetical protein
MRILFLAFALTFASQAAAQNAPPPPDDELIVTGTREREQAARAMVEALSGLDSAAVDTDPISRLDHKPVCPGVVGLRAERNTAIADRIRDVATAAGMSVADARCRPNLLVLFARDKTELLRQLRQQHPALFVDATGSLLSVPEQPGPVTVLHVNRLVDRDGLLVPFDPIAGYHVVSSPNTPSRISASARPIFAASIVVIELNALVGLSPTQIADYAAMRAFTSADPAQVPRLGVDTILTAVEAPEGTAVPITLTRWDLAYLRALTATPNYHYAQRQRIDVRRRMLTELEAQERPQ